MKTELKISTLSIICVLSTMIALPSFGASAVRSLGGAGTYSSASSAATGGAKPATGTVGSVRAGSLRANAPQSTTSSKVSSTRAGATPRLSIGKYLAGGSVIGGAGSSSGTINPGQSSISDLKKTVDDLVVDVEGLKEEIASLTGEYPTIEFENGVLTIVQDGVSEEINLNDYFASEDSLQALEDKINEIVIPDLSEYAKKSDLDGLLTSADLSELQSAVDALELVDESMDAAIKALQGGMVTADELNAKVAELKAVDDGLQAQIDNLKNSTPSTEGLVNKDYVDGLVGQLEAADVALRNAIDAIENPDVDKAYVDDAIADLNEAIVALQGADSAMGQAITDLQTRLDGVATKDEIKDFVTSSDVETQIDAAIEGLVTEEQIADFVTTGKLQEEIAKLATKEEIANFVTSDAVSNAIVEATKGLLTAEDVADFVKSGDMANAIENATSGLATKQELADAKSELQAAIDSINAGQVELTNYYTKEEANAKFATKDEIENFVTSDQVGAQIDSAVEGLLTSDDLSELQSAVDALESADESMNAAIAALQGGMITADDLNAKVAELKAVDDGLQTAIDNLQNSIPSTEGLVNKDYVDGLVGQLEAADVALQNAIDAIEQPDVDKAYVDAAIADLNEAIVALQGADSTMEQAIADLQAGLEDAATKEEIKDFVKSAEVEAKIQEAVAGLATKEEIADFVTTGKLQEEIAKLATQDQIKDFITSEYVTNAIAGLQTAEDVSQAIENATSGLATKQELADAKSELQAAIERMDASQVDLTKYYTKEEANAKFATKDLGNAETAGVTKLYGTTGDSEEGAMTQKAVTDELNAISETLNNFDLDAVLRSVAAQGSYLINFDNAGNVSYTPIEIIGGDFKMLDLTEGAIVPSTTMSLN